MVWRATRKVRSAARRLRRSRVTACRISALRASGTARGPASSCRQTPHPRQWICCRPAGVWPLRITRLSPQAGQTNAPSFERFTPETRPVPLDAPVTTNHYPEAVSCVLQYPFALSSRASVTSRRTFQFGHGETRNHSITDRDFWRSNMPLLPTVENSSARYTRSG